VARFVPAIPGYLYAVSGNELYVNLYMSNKADIDMSSGRVALEQKAGFPWDGKVEIMVDPERQGKLIMKLRIPGWAVNEAIPGNLYRFAGQSPEPYSISVNGKAVDAGTENGYLIIKRKWKKGDRIVLDLPMPVRMVEADERIREDSGKLAVQRGPVIYCAEWPDNSEGRVLNLLFGKDSEFSTEFVPDLLNGTRVIRTKGVQTIKTLEGRTETMPEQTVTLIPYSLWNNRGPGQMMVWLPVVPESARPLPE